VDAPIGAAGHLRHHGSRELPAGAACGEDTNLGHIEVNRGAMAMTRRVAAHLERNPGS
jgi:hypothetical protein